MATKKHKAPKKKFTQTRLLPAVASPIESITWSSVCRLKSDSTDTKDYWMCIDGDEVCIAKQRSGESLIEKIKIPRKDFNRLVRWYVKPQTLTSNGR